MHQTHHILHLWGVYVFKADVLLNLLKWRYPTSNDFGSEIIRAAVSDHNVQSYFFGDYWEDIGTIKSFYNANSALTEVDECKQLRQSIKYGLSKRLTVGEILDKASTLQAIRVNDVLEAKVIQLNFALGRIFLSVKEVMAAIEKVKKRIEERAHEKGWHEEQIVSPLQRILLQNLFLKMLGLL